MNEKSNASFVNKIKNNKKIQFFLIAVLIIVFVVVYYISSKNSNETSFEKDEIQVYIESLEEKLSNILSRVDGVGKVDVIITVSSGMETVLATEKTVKDTQYGTETTEKPILVNGKTVVLKEKYPQITGVVIVSEGANNILVMRKIQEATVSLLDIEVGQIEVLMMK